MKGGGGNEWDPSHCAKRVKELLRKNKNSKTIYLPKRSLYLNAMEKCWLQRKQILPVSEYYETFADMCRAASMHYRTARFSPDLLKLVNRKAASFCANL